MTLLRALRAGTMILAMIVGFVAGTALGLRVFKVLALVPLIMLMLVFAVATSVTATIDVRAYNMLLAIVSPQMGYLFGILVLASRRYGSCAVPLGTIKCSKVHHAFFRAKEHRAGTAGYIRSAAKHSGRHARASGANWQITKCFRSSFSIAFP